jgi:hypothetical protein
MRVLVCHQNSHGLALFDGHQKFHGLALFDGHTMITHEQE